MDRVYASHRGGYSNPDYALDDSQQNGLYQDESKQVYGHVQSLPAQMFENETDTEEDTPYTGSEQQSSLKRIILHIGRLLLTVMLIGLILAIPLFITMNQRTDLSMDDATQNRNFVFWFFVWLEFTFASAVAANIFALVFPYTFYFIAKWVNPAHRRYWRVFRALKGPFVCLMTIIFAAVWFIAFLYFNPWLSYGFWAEQQNIQQATQQANAYGDSTNSTMVAQDLGTDRTIYFTAIDVIVNVLMNAVFWAVAYLFEKIIIVYISVHYHYRSDHARIEKSKALVNSLAALYDASLGLSPLYSDQFQNQDIIIRDAIAAARRGNRDSIRFFQKIGGASHKVLAAFGSMLGTGKDSHWLKPGSTYAIVEHALEKPASAKALAQRIWLSMVPKGKDGLTKERIAEILSLDQKSEAEKCFKAIDENENGDVRLNELEPMLVEAGKTRLNIYENMQNIDHAINTLDWILLIWIAIFMLVVILIGYIDFLQQLKEVFGLVGLGVAAAANSIFTDFFMGCIFIFFKHPYDVGDRIDLFNIGEGNSVGVKVTRVSLLYCCFERTDTGATVQFPNSRLWLKRIENLTRSGQGAEKLTLMLNINTSFKDLEYVRDEMKSFLSAEENRRDYKPNVALRVKSIHELDKMEVAMVVTHKSNWSNDALKSARSSRLYCRLIEIARVAPLYKPNGGIAQLGDEGKPNYMVVVSEEEAIAKRNEDKLKLLKKRHDFGTVNVAGLDNEAKAAREADLKAAEAQAYKGISSVPATLEGRAAERPAAKAVNTPQATSTATQFASNQNLTNRQPAQQGRGSGGGGANFSSTMSRPVYDGSYAYQGGQAELGAPPQAYNARRSHTNGLYDASRSGRT